MVKKILLIGNGQDGKYLGNLIRETKKIAENELLYDFFSVNDISECPFIDQLHYYHKVQKHFPNLLYKIPKLRGLVNIIDIKKSIIEFAGKVKDEGIKYDVCNIHFLSGYYLDVINSIRSVSRKIVLSPWGSDILKAKKSTIKKINLLIKKSDFILSPNDSSFRTVIKNILSVTDDKLYDIDFGDIMIDVLLDGNADTKDYCKEACGLKDRYVIVCGYNGSCAQNHIQIINSINLIKEKLPQNYILLLPMTYGANQSYINDIQLLLDKFGIKYKILDSFLSKRQLALMRKATDLFVHAQTTDANCGTIKEYLLCNTKIINASWLNYPHYTKYGNPFYIFDNFNDLPKTILSAISDKKENNSDALIEDIKKYSWHYRAPQWVNLYTKY